MSNFKIKFIAIPSEIGGYKGEFYENMRSGIIWQKNFFDASKTRYDISLTNIVYNEIQKLWEADCMSIQDFPINWLEEGELIGLIGTYNIIAIGSIMAQKM